MNQQLPPDLAALAQQQAIKAGVRAGAQFTPDFLQAMSHTVAAKIAANPQTASQQVWQQIQQGLQPPAQVMGEAGTDPTLLQEMQMLFQQTGFPPNLALDYARYLTPGYQPSRPLGAEEIDAIHKLLNAPDIRAITAAAAPPSPTLVQPLQPVSLAQAPVWTQLVSSSPLLAAVALIAGWLIWQTATTCQAPPVRSQVVAPHL
jgi:hypothetical protein